MAITAVGAIVSSLLYFYISYILWNRFLSKNATSIDWARNRFLLYALIAVSFQLISFSSTLFSNDLIMLDLGNSLSLISWLAVLALLASNFKQHTENLGIFIFPLAAFTSVLTFIPNNSAGIPLELGIHIILSIGAYSILGLAAAQAILYASQERKFQQKELTTLFKALPPLQVMENTMIQFISFGFILLTLSLTTGMYFIENMFAQHLIHKTFFAILAWIIYGVFLIGHFRFGWRGQVATKFTIWAYILLILSYIGTELILIFLV